MVEPIAEPLRERLAAWAGGSVDELRDAWPTIPEELGDRAADGWEPLFAIAELAGGDWPERARRAALELSAGDVREDDSAGVAPTRRYPRRRRETRGRPSPRALT